MENAYYPAELARKEQSKVIARRRSHQPGLTREEAEVAPTVGLALSGGGIRSATFCLGVCQHLAKSKLLRKIDYLSTVSGGGFFGSFLGAWIHRTNFSTVEAGLPQNENSAIQFLRENGRYIAPNGSGDIGVAVASYLRGWVAVLGTLGIFVFSFLVLGAAAQESLLSWLPETWRPISLFWYSHSGGFWVSPWWVAPYVILILWILPLCAAFWLLGDKPLRLTPLIWAFMGLIIIVLVKCYFTEHDLFWRMLWRDFRGLIGIFSLLLAARLWARSRRPSNIAVWLKCAALGSAVGCYFAFNGPHLPLPWSRYMFSPAIIIHQILRLWPVNFAFDRFDADLIRIAAVMLGLAWVVAFASAALSNNVDLVRRKLTELTTLGLWAIAVFCLFAFIDTLGGSFLSFLQGPLTGDRDSTNLFHRLLQLAPAATVASAALQKILAMFSASSVKKPVLALPMAVLVALAAFLIAIICLTFLSLCAHFIAVRLNAVMIQPYEAGTLAPSTAVGLLWGVAGGLLLLSCCVGHTKTLLNLSSDLQLYTSRLTRAYLGATNPGRQNSPARQNVTQPDAEDDIPYTEYHPEEHGGPLHIINVTVNETISGRSNLEQKDRHGYSMAIGPVGISVGRFAHAIIGNMGGVDFSERFARHLDKHSPSLASSVRQAGIFVASRWRRTRQIQPLPGPGFHPLAQDAANPTTHDIEMPTLGSWVSISGAAFSTGLGQQTNSGYSFLTGFFNVRLGYWWDSELSPIQRKGANSLGFSEWMGVAATALFPAQSYLLDEFLARFHGPAARRLWNLSDGGHFENTAVYELLRRRVQFIITCDCGQDPEYHFEDIAVLVRKARIDFNAEITFLTRLQLKDLLDPSILPLFGDIDACRDPAKNQPPFNAALARIVYLDEKSPPSHLLVLKPAVRGDEPTDLLDYHAKEPMFPQQPTADQSFDEAQWESYRRLGALVAERVFAPVPENENGQRWWPSELAAREVIAEAVLKASR